MPPMSPWPKNKVTKSLPFQNTGLDYFGPLYIKQNGNEKNKESTGMFVYLHCSEGHPSGDCC